MLSSPSATDRLIEVAVPVPGLGLLTYRVPGHDPLPPKGARVNVPLGTREVTGCVVRSQATAPAAAEVRDVTGVLDHEPFLPDVIVDLALWVAEYYAAGPGDALLPAMPPAARRGRHSAYRTVRRALPLPAPADADTALSGAKQREALALLRMHPGGLSLPDLLARGVGTSTIRSLVRHGLASLRDDVVERDPFAGEAGDAGRWSLKSDADPRRPLTPEQAHVFRHLEEAAAVPGFQTMLLHGVTGSGKTEV